MKINKKVESFAVNELGVDPRYDGEENDNITIEEWRLVEALQKA